MDLPMDSYLIRVRRGVSWDPHRSLRNRRPKATRAAIAMLRDTSTLALSAAVLALLGGSAEAVGCNTCHLNNDYGEYGQGGFGATKETATPTDFPPGSKCSQYRSASCCSVEVANNLNLLYGDKYNWKDRCGGMSDRCAQYFFDEGCFYECDVNAGRFRRHPNCEENAWEMYHAPVKASYCDAMFEACKNERYCHSEDRSAFGDCDPNTDCKPIGEIYADGKDLCETIWGDAFKYETNERDAFTFHFEPGRLNPNDLVLLDVSFPDACEGIHNGSMVDDCVASGLLQQNIMRAVRELETMMDEQSTGSGNAKDIAIAGLVFGLVGFMIGAFLIFTTQCRRGSKGVPSF